MYRLCLILPVLLLMGCSSLPPKTDAIHTALTTDAAIRSAVDQCGLTSVEARRQSIRAQLDWWQRNRTYVIGADQGLLQLYWDQLREQSEAPRAILAMQTLEAVQTDAASLSESWVGAQPTERDCQKLVERINNGKYELDRPRSQAERLNAWYEQRDIDTVALSSSRSVNTRYRKYGRSLFLVEKALSEAGCSDPNIALLRNSWPIEVYDAVCGQDDYVLVRCEWGRCEVKR